MQRHAFIAWLTGHRNQKANTARSRAANCATVESAYELDLDTLSQDEFGKLLEQFLYSRRDEAAGMPVRHRVRINGVQYTGTAMYGSALNLYRAFRFHPVKPPGSPPEPFVEPLGSPTEPPAHQWPEWEAPSEDDSLLLARVLARHARFLNPKIVCGLVEDNRKLASDWRTRLEQRGVPADAYLWEGSPCAFPGVRRYSGSDEIAIHRGRKGDNGKPRQDALRLDDNDYPKHLWSFLFRGKPFQKHGPKGYNLAHLADHKNHNNRAAQDFVLNPPALSVDGKLHGLFTCATNTVFLPAGLLKPTDFHAEVRGLFIRKAQALYGAFCNIVPPFMSVRECDDSRWSIAAFDWAEPVGDPAQLDPFLSFRAERMASILAQG